MYMFIRSEVLEQVCKNENVLHPSRLQVKNVDSGMSQPGSDAELSCLPAVCGLGKVALFSL